MKIVAYFAALGLALTGCSQAARHGFDLSALRQAIARNEVIKLNKFTSFSWDRIHIFEPYTSPDTIKHEVGKDIPFPHHNSGGYCLLVFLKGDTVVTSFEVQRSDADFTELYRPGGYALEDAIFKVKQTTDGWHRLESAQPITEPSHGSTPRNPAAAEPQPPPAFEIRLAVANTAPDTQDFDITNPVTKVIQVLHVHKMPFIDQTEVRSASVKKVKQNPNPFVDIALTDAGRARLAEVTRDNVGTHLAIFVDGKLLTTPLIMAEVPDGKAWIFGNLTEQEALDIAAKINQAISK